MRPGSPLSSRSAPVHPWSQFTSANSRPLSRPERKPLNVFELVFVRPLVAAPDTDIGGIHHHIAGTVVFPQPGSRGVLQRRIPRLAS